MNHLETGVANADSTARAAIPAPIGPASNAGLVWNGSSWVAAALVNANIDAAAAIAYTKLQLAGSIINNDVSVSAAIAYSKLNLGTSIVNTDVAAAAAIATSKLADPTTGKVIGSSGSAAAAVFPPAYEVAYVEATSPVTTTATTAATATNILSAGAVTFDGSLTLIQFFAPNVRPASAAGQTECFLNLWLDGVDLGIIAEVGNYTGGAGFAPSHVVKAERRLTPSAGSHTFIVKGWEAGGTATVEAGAGGAGVLLPMFIRITKV